MHSKFFKVEEIPIVFSFNLKVLARDSKSCAAEAASPCELI